MLKSFKKYLSNTTSSHRVKSNAKCFKGTIPNSVLKKQIDIDMQLSGGCHPQSLGAKKLRCLPKLYRMRVSNGFRLLIGFDGQEWVSSGIYPRQYFTTLVNKRRR
ncbi:hypothetical protein Q4601_14305 [Shewanella sp. 1_MG-2023]|uniref:hypothetical protein n=1 Tax=unclassified Shewanella TaxID=196818 RepID=UPI0026E30B28|nr:MULTISPECIES: hypothetical protein [unclassified Shewanella]MDO6611381.1 hypothetical protein [Shewanella sp. 7_MG-2023]MDO6771236.1 hypothetical protein [Shewanella sp. 2_MG-2023]MDO6795477.1 hypothetical protein [Shewanella sp. 1_MG-2023]